MATSEFGKAFAAARKEMLLIAEIDQRVQTVHSLDNHIAAIPAVAAIGAAIFDELFTAKRNAARTTGTGPDIDLGKIEKLHRFGLSGLFSAGDSLLCCASQAMGRVMRRFSAYRCRKEYIVSLSPFSSYSRPVSSNILSSVL